MPGAVGVVRESPRRWSAHYTRLFMTGYTPALARPWNRQLTVERLAPTANALSHDFY